MTALAYDRVATTERARAGEHQEGGPEHGDERSTLSVVPEDGQPGESIRSFGVEALAGGWSQAALAVIAVVALMAVGGALADAAVGATGARPPAGASSAARPGATGNVYVVQPGETYWSIAEGLGGEGDIRTRVDALEEANGGRFLRAGDRLVLPGRP